MRDWEISLDPASAAAGPITFAVTNDGPTTHEFEIFSGDVDPSSLPVESGVAITDGLELVDEVEDVTAGSTAELSVDLDPGTYALICNLADHYEEGMFTTLHGGVMTDPDHVAVLSLFRRARSGRPLTCRFMPNRL